MVKSDSERWFSSFREAAAESLDCAPAPDRFPEADGAQTTGF
jgi:hypothetical protein